jgi:hypothetical protein
MGELLTKSSTTASRITDNPVEIITAQSERTTSTANAFVDTVAMRFLMLKLIRMLGIPVSLERIGGRHAMSVQTVTSRWETIPAFGTAVVARLPLAGVRRSERGR